MSTEPVRDLEPDRLTQNESAEWSRSFCDYAATEWTLQYRFRGPGTGCNIDATADGDAFAAEITEAQTGAMAVGRYEWQAWVTNIADTTVIRKIAEGTLDIELGFAENTTSTVELRSAAKIALDSIDAAMTAFATSDVLEYEISTPAGTRRVKRSARADLIQLRKYYSKIVARENRAAAIRNGQRKFGEPIVINVRES